MSVSQFWHRMVRDTHSKKQRILLSAIKLRLREPEREKNVWKIIKTGIRSAARGNSLFMNHMQHSFLTAQPPMEIE